MTCNQSDTDVEKRTIEETTFVDDKRSIGEKWSNAPDGGWKAWFVVAGSFLVGIWALRAAKDKHNHLGLNQSVVQGLFATQGFSLAWGVLFNYYNTQVYPGDNMVALSWIGSLWFCLCGITNPLYQWMSSKFNDRYLILIACIFSGLSLILASITNEIWQLYITIGVMSGLSASLLWTPCLQRGLEWFSERRALAVGIITSGVGIGGLVYSNIFTACFQTVGYAWGLRIVGFSQLLLIGISVVACVRLNPPAKKDVPILELQVFKHKKYLIVFCLHLLSNFANRVPYAYMSSYAERLGSNPWVTGNINAIASACLAIGKILMGYLADRIGRLNVGILCASLATIAHFAIWLTATTEASMWVFAVLQGISQGGYMAIIYSLINDYVPLDLADAAIGWALFAWAPGGLLSQPITSYIIDRGNGIKPYYQGAIIFSGLIYFLSACLVFILRIMKGGLQIFQKI